MKNKFKLFDFMGTPVYLKYWFFILLLFVNFDISLFISVFIAVLIHELAHTYVARKLNYYVSEIYLDIFHGAARIDTASQFRHKHNLMITSAGPLSNIVLFFIIFLLMIPFPDVKFLQDMKLVNLVLFFFNILPIYPMDGGRITKALFSITLDALGVKRANKKAKLYNGVLSMIMTVLLLVFSIVFGFYFIAIFSLLFIYTSYREIVDKNHF